MPRLPRLVLSGLPHHVIARGNDRMPIVRSDSDYRMFLSEVAGLSQEHGIAIHAYVLMTNHVHLLCAPDQADGLSKFMQALGRRYVRYFNDRHGRSGTLWEGRFRSCVVQSDAHLWVCHRYIELNPVRAGMTRSPAEYPWSSYAHNALGKADPIVTPCAEYLLLGRTARDRCARYRDAFEEGLEDEVVQRLRQASERRLPFGTEAFVRDLEQRSGRRLSPGRRGRPRKMESDPK